MTLPPFPPTLPRRKRNTAPMLLCVAAFTLSACHTTHENWALGIGATALLARAPTQEIEQVYYLGVFDPQDQVPPTIYRVRVFGQASAMSSTYFASGWVPAQVIDSLTSQVGANVPSASGPGGVQITKSEHDLSRMETGRRLVQFGPEGFRETPRDHRLVIVMGSSPESFFSAIDTALGTVAQAQAESRDNALVLQLFESLRALRTENELLQDIDRELMAAKATGS